VAVLGKLDDKSDKKLQNDPRWALVLRIAESQHFRNSARLCQFLSYVAECAIREQPEAATEQQIGIRVFGRSAGYNSSEDSIVRTHARLLRQKLAAYFADEGRDEPLLVDVPKGHYLPDFTPRPSAEPVATAEPAPPAPVRMSQFAARRLTWLALPLLALAATLLVWHPWTHSGVRSPQVSPLWQPFLTGDPPIVIYSNALFTGDSTNGLRYAAPPTANQSAQTPYVDTYTGIGELNSVYQLTQLFDAQHRSFVLKRSLLVTWDEAQARNLIFIGSWAENPSLRVLPTTSDFTMIAQPEQAGIVNHHPKAGEPTQYLRPEHPLTSDYAIVALLPGVQPGKRILLFSGLTTFGTQAAVEFFCNPDSASGILSQISTANGGLRPFEAVLETTIAGGVPMQTRLVTLRIH
jgi:hypothetical protein